MIGHIVALLFSWALLWLIERRNLLALGFTPVPKRIYHLTLGFFFSAFLCASIQLTESYMMHASWHLNPQISVAKIGEYLWRNVNSVLFEEFIFRGALLFIAIKRLGKTKGIILSAVAFGIYHWFSFAVFGSIVPMIFVFVITGLMGYAWAYAFAKTKSMALPIGFHLGWNFTFNAIFSKGVSSFPVLVLMKTNDTTTLTGMAAVTNAILQNLLPSITTYLFVRFIIKKHVDKKERFVEESVAVS